MNLQLLYIISRKENVENHNSQKSPKLLISFYLVILFIIAIGNNAMAQCTNTALYPASVITPDQNAWKTISPCNWAGEYANVNVTAGNSYSFSTCSGDGASCSYDSELTLRNSSGGYLAYNDDNCGVQSFLSWTATYTGTVQIHLNWVDAGWFWNDYCLSNTLCTEMRVFELCPAPSQPSAITGTSDPVPGASETYSVTNVSGTTYTWTVPAGWTITSGQSSNSITVTVGNSNGTISVTPSNVCGNGTARTLYTTIPNYRAALSNITYGSSTWCGGEERDVTIDVQNTGTATWNTTYNTNLGVAWVNGANSWSDYHVRTSTGNLAPGASQNYTLTIEGKEATGGPVYGSNLSGSYNLQFDIVNEMSCWFANNNGSCGPGNSVAQSSSITHAPGPTNPTATADGGSSADICAGGTVALVGSATGADVSGSTSESGSGGATYGDTYASCTPITISFPALPAGATVTSVGVTMSATSNGASYRSEIRVNIDPPAVFGADQSGIQPSSLGSSGSFTDVSIGSFSASNPAGSWVFTFLETYVDGGNPDASITDITITVNYTAPGSVSYAWSLDGGTTPMTTGASATSDALNSNATITMTATDDNNSCTSTATASVTVNGLPSNSSVAISSNSTPPRNNDDITATISTSDPESAAVYSENDWRVDGSSFAVQNLSFDANGSDGLTSHSSQGGALTAYGDATQVAGVKGQAYEFDGVNDYLQNSSVNIDPSNGLSISLWQYTITTASSSGNDAYHQWVNLGPGQQMVLRNSFTNGIEAYVSTGGNLTGWCSGCGTGDFIYLTNQVSAGSWNHWVVTWNPDRTFKLYKNGTLIKTNVAAEGALSTITSLSISGNSAENFNGKIDELLIFERDISADQVTALYNSGTPSYSTIPNDETSCGESWALSSTPVDAAGCSGSTTTSTAVSISGAQVTTADVTDVTTCGLDNYAIAIDDASDVGVWEVSPANAALIDDPSAPSTTVTASPVANPTNGFNSDLTFTWVPTDNNCTSDNVTIKFNQPVISGTMDNYCWAWGGGTNSNWSTGSNWYKWDGIKWAIQSTSYPDAGSKVYILPSSETCVTNGAINASASLEDLNIQGGSFDLGSANTSITGDIINDGGTLQGGSGTVTLNGSGAQSITGSGVNTNFNNLIINNSNDISSDIQIVVENALTMISGNINNSSPLILGSSSANSGILNHTTGIITGEFRRYFPNATGSQMFPVGTSSIMRDVSVNFTSPPGTDQYLTASYVTGAPTLFGGGGYEGLPLVTEDGQLIQNYDNEGHWVINPTNDDYSSSINGKAYTISMHMNNISDATDYTKTRIIKSAGSNTASQHHLSWGALTGQSVSGYNGTAPSNSNFAVTATSTGFSLFGAGSDDGAPLPVELVSFTGNCADGVVDVTWTTASEYNSSYFELENSRDGITWDVVYTKDAAGQSTELTEYTYNDVHANGGDNYYRLTQVDIDGTSKTYDVINASCSQTTSGYFSIYPNPSSGSFKVILNNAEIIGDARMNVVDTKGNIVLSKPLDVKSGINMYVVNEDLAPGIYYVSVQNGDKVTVVLKHSVK